MESRPSDQAETINNHSEQFSWGMRRVSVARGVQVVLHDVGTLTFGVREHVSSSGPMAAASPRL